MSAKVTRLPRPRRKVRRRTKAEVIALIRDRGDVIDAAAALAEAAGNGCPAAITLTWHRDGGFAIMRWGQARDRRMQAEVSLAAAHLLRIATEQSTATDSDP